MCFYLFILVLFCQCLCVPCACLGLTDAKQKCLISWNSALYLMPISPGPLSFKCSLRCLSLMSTVQERGCSRVNCRHKCTSGRSVPSLWNLVLPDLPVSHPLAAPTGSQSLLCLRNVKALVCNWRIAGGVSSDFWRNTDVPRSLSW